MCSCSCHSSNIKSVCCSCVCEFDKFPSKKIKNLITLSHESKEVVEN